jgi:hypothetical protein
LAGPDSATPRAKPGTSRVTFLPFSPAQPQSNNTPAAPPTEKTTGITAASRVQSNALSNQIPSTLARSPDAPGCAAASHRRLWAIWRDYRGVEEEAIQEARSLAERSVKELPEQLGATLARTSDANAAVSDAEDPTASGCSFD